MSEQEFELYLSLLSLFLRLSPLQRQEIADELRDHLEQRMDELSRRGMPRDEAIRQALEEFGDAAGLASHFTHIARDRKRRLIMRCTFGSIATLAAAMLITTAFWPDNPQVPVNRRAVADQEPAVEQNKQPDPSEFPSFKEDRKNALVEAKLDTEVDFNFVDTPLDEALNYISETHKVSIIMNHSSLADEGLTGEEPINLNVRGIRLRTTLELFFEPLGLTYRLRDGMIYVETELEAAKHLEVRVYNCRDLISGGEAVSVSTSSLSPSRVGARRGDDDDEDELAANWGSSVRREGIVGDDDDLDEWERGRAQRRRSSGRSTTRPATDRTQALIQVVENSTSGPWENIDGEGGTIVAYDGLLIVRQTQAMHREIKEFLERIRFARGETVARDRRSAEPGQILPGGREDIDEEEAGDLPRGGQALVPTY